MGNAGVNRMRRVEIGLFLAGLLLRAPGLVFNGMADPEPWVFDWGPRVRSDGLARAFSGEGGYGILSFWFAGVAYRIADVIPRFWWAPHKFFELCFETGILWLLARLLGAERKRWAFYLFWLNPWFILHGSWHGYWDGTHTFTVLLALVFLREIGDERAAWAAAGAALAGSAMFKPQGLIFFAIPVLFLLAVQFLRERKAALVWYAIGLLTLMVGAGAYLVVGDGDAAALPRQYVFVSEYMVALCDNCVGVWRPVTRLLQALYGQSGPTWGLELPRSLFAVLDRTGMLLAVLIMVVYALRLPAIPCQPWTGEPGRFLRLCGVILLLISGLGWLRSSDPAQHATLFAGRYSPFYFSSLLALLAGGILLTAAGPALYRVAQRVLHRLHHLVGGKQDPATSPERHFPVLLLMIVSGLTIPQLGTRAHENHTYAALVLMILLAAPDLHAPSFRRPRSEAKGAAPSLHAPSFRRPLLPIWATMCAAHLLVTLSHYRFGRAQLLPTFHLDTAPAQPLLSKIRPLVDSSSSDGLLSLQDQLNGFIQAVLPPEPISTIAATVQAICFVLALVHLHRVATVAGRNVVK